MKIGGRVPPEPWERYAVALPHGCEMRYLDTPIGRVTSSWVDEDGGLCFEADIDPAYRRMVETESRLSVKVLDKEEDLPCYSDGEKGWICTPALDSIPKERSEGIVHGTDMADGHDWSGIVLSLDGHASPTDVAQVKQDLLDGTALHRLRDALPEGWSMSCMLNPRGPHWCVEVRRTWDPRWTPWISRDGDTIAEAADAAREALE